MPTAAGFTACQTSTYGWPVTRTYGLVTLATTRLSLLPGHQVVDEHAEPAAGAAGRTGRPRGAGRRRRPAPRRRRPRPAGRRPRPARRAARRACPRPRSGCRGRPARAGPATAIDPDAVVRRPVGAVGTGRASTTGPALERGSPGRAGTPAPGRAGPPATTRSLSHSDDGAAPAGHRLLDHQPGLGRHARPRAAGGRREAATTSGRTAWLRTARPYGGGRGPAAGAATPGRP